MIQTSLFLEKEGVDSIELSGGTGIKASRYPPSRITIPHSNHDEVYYEKAAEQFKKNITIPLILVGGIRSLQTAGRLIKEGKADLISLCRPLIKEPDLVKKWQEGSKKDASCVSCNRCFEPARSGEGIYCVIDKEKNINKF